MKKAVLTFVGAFVLGFVGYANYVTYTDASSTFKPTFDVDYTDCGTVTHNEGSVQFGDASTSCGGRLSLMKATLTFHRFVLQQT